MQPDQLIHFPLLSESAYLAAVQKAETTIRDRLVPPDLAHYASGSTGQYPRWFMGAILSALGLVLLTSFIVSAGHQSAALGILFDTLPGKFSHLSETWANASIVSMLLLSEVGAFLFLVSAGTLGAVVAPSTVWRFRLNLPQITFMAFAVFCASLAIVGNVTIAALTPTPQANVLEWMVAVGVPAVVLGLASLMERLIVDALRSSAERKAAYNANMQAYRAVIADPTKHTSWAAILSDCLWSALNLRHKAALDAYTSQDARYRRWIVQGEFRAHQEPSGLELEASNPFLELPEGNSPQ